MRRNVGEQLLTSAGISWNASAKNFEYCRQHPSFDQVCARIPDQLGGLKFLARRLEASLEQLDAYRQAIQIGDYLENMLGLIADFKVGSDHEAQLFKNELHREFIYTAAECIRNKSSLELPPNIRNLNVNAVKVFIAEVFLKQQLLGYGFKTLRNRQLQQSEHPLLSGFLSREQKDRQLEVVQASSYLYALGPALEYDANPFTLRRFLLEERLFGGSLLLNGAVLNTAARNTVQEEHFCKCVRSILTIQGNIRQVIFDFAENLELFHEDTLIPLLFLPFQGSGHKLAQDVGNRLQQYEQQLSKGILEPLAENLRRLPHAQEEFDYLYRTAMRLLSSAITVFKDFMTLPAVLMNRQAELMLGRLTAYAFFLEKRRADVFAAMDQAEWQANARKTKLLPRCAKEAAAEFKDEYRKCHTAVIRQKALVDKPVSWIGRWLNTQAKQEAKLAELEKQLRKVRFSAHNRLWVLPDTVGGESACFIFDVADLSNETIRYYAFPRGSNGISELPGVFTLPANRLVFDLDDFLLQINEVKIDDDDAEKVLLRRV